MDAEQRAARATSALNDEIVQLAFTETLKALNKELLNAKTSEEREQKWQEYHGLKRAWTKLQTWPYGSKPKKP